jgi:hypothetical protein
MKVYHIPSGLLVVSDVPVSADVPTLEVMLADGTTVVCAKSDLEIWE